MASSATSSTIIMSSTWASVVPAGTVPRPAPPFRRPLCPSWRAGFEPIPTKSGASRASGLICGSWERRRPGPASAASRSLQKIVGAIVGVASRTGRERLQGSSPPDFHLTGRNQELRVEIQLGAVTTSAISLSSTSDGIVSIETLGQRRGDVPPRARLQLFSVALARSMVISVS